MNKGVSKFTGQVEDIESTSGSLSVVNGIRTGGDNPSTLKTEVDKISTLLYSGNVSNTPVNLIAQPSQATGMILTCDATAGSIGFIDDTAGSAAQFSIPLSAGATLVVPLDITWTKATRAVKSTTGNVTVTIFGDLRA